MLPLYFATHILIFVFQNRSKRKEDQTKIMEGNKDFVNGSPFRCLSAVCDRQFDSANELVYHQLNAGHFDGKYCALCNRSYAENCKLKRHLESIHGNKIFRCQSCDVTFNREDSLRRHEISIHNRGKCRYCGELFFDAGLLKEHQQLHKVSSESALSEAVLNKIY